MSFFISSMPDAGLMSRPPVSKVTPLPIIATFGASSRPQEKSTSRGCFGARATDRVDEGKVRGDEFLAAHHADAGVEMLGELDGLLFKRVGAERVGGRVDEVATEGDRLCDALNPDRVDLLGRRRVAALATYRP